MRKRERLAVSELTRLKEESGSLDLQPIFAPAANSTAQQDGQGQLNITLD